MTSREHHSCAERARIEMARRDLEAVREVDLAQATPETLIRLIGVLLGSLDDMLTLASEHKCADSRPT